VATLTPTEVRVLGALIEKEITTPEYYPLTVNALTIACNQRNNRNPVTAYSEQEVEEALNELRAKNLAYVFHGSTSRVPKYKHVAAQVLELDGAEIAVLCALMLSGPQTVGEIRTRASRLYSFADLDQVEETLRALTTRQPDALVIKLPRQAGQKEVRFAQLLAGQPEVEPAAAEEAAPRTSRRAHEEERIEKLEQTVEGLATEFEKLRTQFEAFRKQFE
jgi:uncharacterized protein